MRRKKIPDNVPHCFEILGQIHEYILDLFLRISEDPFFGHLYFIDSMEATNYRIDRKGNYELTKVAAMVLQNILTQFLFGRVYRTATEAMTHLLVVEDLNLRFVDNMLMEKCVYNTLTAKESAYFSVC